jgi:hypothetical protein
VSQSPPTNDDWARAFAKQAGADFDCWSQVSDPGNPLPQCHKLLFLQMACEKLGKAHAYKSNIVPEDIQTSHLYCAKYIPQIVRQILIERRKPPKQREFVISHSRRIAREIELLNPSVNDGGGRPDNCEYPWVDAKNILRVPCESTFLPSRLVIDANGRNFLKIVELAIDKLLDQ